MTTSSWLRLTALALTTTTLAACGGGGDDGGGGDTGDSGGSSASEQACTFGAAEKRESYKPLPDGLRYEKATKQVLEEAERSKGEGITGVDARPVSDESGTIAAVIVQGVEKPIKDEESFREDLAKGAGGQGEDVEVDGTTLTRIEADGAVIYARIYESCRVVSVYAPKDAAAKRIARAVLT